ncbi:virulence-like protein (plasmid) [Peptoclostridium acidaminophilum DSM 3953]|uniref:Virulence-like protein n=1 Tax=Peptoclostridium acidaminophilum DSM 3953 TaxID=1286171 RepID=W8UA46_PEPAC|nr:hypothetical protein [Peptoclostridium acidaminophilum]AHM57671.1 virulence-like protein [Peptoclostridium acidaminophilum DSM 3953]
MEIKFNCTSTERKALVSAIGELLEIKPAYQGAPSFAFKIGGFMVDKNSELFFDEQIDISEVELLIERLAERGFEAEVTENLQEKAALEEVNEPTPNKDKINDLVIELPRAAFTDSSFANLTRLLESKEELIQKALGLEKLPVEITDEKVSFPWFSFPISPEEIKAYSHFIYSLAKLSKEQKRVTAKAKEIENEKYAFRCFLLRLGFIGDEYKAERKILLSKLTGSSAFKSGETKQNEAE